ncbi:MAG: hypothetical protein OXJ52_05910 [Oligoflexia bacterium]|nr:hypothetical protein [Oligoflexia bacterium]
MKLYFKILLILCSVFLISCKKEYAVSDPSEPIDILYEEDPYKSETDLPKEIRITGKYTFTENNKNFYFENEDQDSYCYYLTDNKYLDEDLVSIRFRLYDKNNKLLHERLPILSNSGRRSIIEFKEKIKKYPPNIRSLYFVPDEIKKIKEGIATTVWTHVPYHKDGAKIKAILVDDQGKELKVLAERGILPPEEFRKRSFYEGCYREVDFHK